MAGEDGLMVEGERVRLIRARRLGMRSYSHAMSLLETSSVFACGRVRKRVSEGFV